MTSATGYFANYAFVLAPIHRDRVVDGAAKEHEIVDAIVKLSQ